MSVDPPLSAEETKVLNVLMAPGTRATNSTSGAISHRSNLEPPITHQALPSLENRQPPLVRSEIDATLNERVWFSTYDAVEAFEET